MIDAAPGRAIGRPRKVTAVTTSDQAGNGVVALVLSGAGARGAYEAGALSVLLPLMKGADRPAIILGTSVGALNTAMLASSLAQVDDVDRAARALVENWRRITPRSVFLPPRAGAWHFVFRRRGTVAGLLDTKPLWATLREFLGPGAEFAPGVTPGVLRALGVVASSCASARAVVFVQTDLPPPPPGPGVEYAATALTIDHLLASSAFPVAFAPWMVSHGPAPGWYMDGGVHLNTPLKPAIDLGADRVLVIGATPMGIGVTTSAAAPDLMDATGQLLQAMLVDTLRADLASLQRVNDLCGSSPTGGAHRLVRCFALSPPDDALSQVAADVWPPGLLRLVRSLGGYRALGQITAQRQRPGQFLSYLCFDRDFIAQAIELGQADARRALGGSPVIPWEPR
jgi:NTE family protein